VVVVATVHCQIFKCIFIVTSNGARHDLTISASGSAHHQQGKGKFSEFRQTELRDISAKAVIPLNS
jgi:hypothetical protein